MDDSSSLNRANWDERAVLHAASDGYGLQRYVTDPQHLSPVVEFDQPLLGDVSGARGIHLQCHLGTDTVSLSRLGAEMSGLDFSGPALEQARRLAERTGATIDFRRADVYAALEVFPAGSFDLVYTGIGALCWLPRIRDWAAVVAGLLAPGGRLFLRESHPVLWALAEPRPDGAVALEFPYFERAEPTVWDEPSTYVDSDAALTASVTEQWNHGLGEIIQALLDTGLVLTGLVEHQSVPYDALPGQMTLSDDGEWQLTDRPWRLPHTYTLQAVKPT